MSELRGLILNDRYHLDAILGPGGVSVVYRARDALLDQDDAVKVVGAESVGTEGRARQLRKGRLSSDGY